MSVISSGHIAIESNVGIKRNSQGFNFKSDALGRGKTEIIYESKRNLIPKSYNTYNSTIISTKNLNIRKSIKEDSNTYHPTKSLPIINPNTQNAISAEKYRKMYSLTKLSV